MVSQTNYVPPPYIPLSQSDAEAETVTPVDATPAQQHMNNVPEKWSSGICACCDDMQSCCVGLICPCYLFAKNAEFLGSGTLMGSCTTHFILWSLVNSVCCVLTDGILWGLPGCFVACYACGYRRTLRKRHAEISSLISAAIYVPYVKNIEKFGKGLEVQIFRV